MRLLPILTILVAAVVIAGCAKKDDTGGSTTTPTPSTPKTTPTPTPSATPTGTTPTTSTPTTTTPTTPTTVTPKEIKKGSVTWPTDCSTPSSTAGQTPGPCTPIAVTIDSGYTTLNFTVTWSCSTTPVCGSNGASIAIGTLKCDAPQTIDPNTVPAKCTKPGPATAGAAKIVPSGDGLNIVATFTLVEQ